MPLNANAMITEPWVTAEQVAQHLGVVKDTVYRWRERKGLPAHKVARLWKFQLSEVDEWVRAGGADESADVTSQVDVAGRLPFGLPGTNAKTGVVSNANSLWIQFPLPEEVFA